MRARGVWSSQASVHSWVCTPWAPSTIGDQRGRCRVSTLQLFSLRTVDLHTQHLNISRGERVLGKEESFKGILKDVRTYCYCASLLRTLFIKHTRATSFLRACTESKTQQNIELMTLALTWCADIFVGCSVNPTFFLADHFLFWFFPLH